MESFIYGLKEYLKYGSPFVTQMGDVFSMGVLLYDIMTSDVRVIVFYLIVIVPNRHSKRVIKR